MSCAALMLFALSCPEWVCGGCRQSARILVSILPAVLGAECQNVMCRRYSAWRTKNCGGKKVLARTLLWYWQLPERAGGTT